MIRDLDQNLGTKDQQIADGTDQRATLSAPVVGPYAATFLFVVILLVILGLFGSLFWATYRTSQHEAQATAQNLAGVLSTSLEGSLERAESDIRTFLPHLTERDLTAPLTLARQTELEQGMESHLHSFPAVLNYRVFNQQGQTLLGAGSSNPHAEFNVSDRQWFRQLRDAPDKTLVISEVVIGKGTLAPTILIAIPIRDRQGRFLGALNAAIDLNYFQRQIDSLAIGQRGVVALRRADDLRLILHRPRQDLMINASPFPDTELSNEISSGQVSGSGLFTSSIDGLARTYAFRTLHDYPITVILALAKSDYLAPWRQQTLASGLLALILSAALALLYHHQQKARLALKTHAEAIQISERRLASEANRFRQLLQTASDGIHIVDEKGRLVLASDSFYRMLGLEGAPAQPLHISDWDAQSTSEELIAQIAHGLQQPATFCTRHRRRDGTITNVEIRSRPVDLDGQTYLYCSARDISQRLQDAENLARSNAELEQFAYVASHDLREPLRMVSSYISLIRRELGDPIPDDLATFLNFAIDGARRMDRLILDLLEYSRVGRVNQPFGPVNLGDCIQQACNDLQVNIDESHAHIQIEADPPTIVGNSDEIIRLFQNLIGNAIKYRSADKAPVIEIGWRPAGRDVILWVSDNGIGIAPEFHERIFGIFQRLVSREHYEGTGIGLAICKKIVEHHHGRIWVESGEGQGTSFLFALPK